MRLDRGGMGIIQEAERTRRFEEALNSMAPINLEVIALREMLTELPGGLELP